MTPVSIGLLMSRAGEVDRESRVTEAAGERAYLVDWSVVRQVGPERTEIPTQVTAPGATGQSGAEPRQSSLSAE